MENAIKKAIEGGYKRYEDHLQNSWGTDTYFPMVCLDPLFWQALGKQQGWGILVCMNCRVDGWSKQNECKNCDRGGIGIITDDWKTNWHNFIDHIVVGGSIDEFFNNLLK